MSEMEPTTQSLIEDSQVEQVNGVIRKVTVKIYAQTVKERIDAAFGELKKSAAIKGFRKGKVPRNILKRYYGDQIEGEVKSQLLGEAFKDILERHSIEMVAEPEIEKADIGENGEFESVLIFQVKPDVTVQDYKGLEIKREKVQVLDAAIDQRLEGIRNSHATMVPVEEDRPAASGDAAVVDILGLVDGEPFKDAQAEGMTFELGSGQYIKELEEGIVGMSVGDTKEIKIDNDGEKSEELKGKELVYKVTLKELKKKVLPDLDDDFAKDLGGDFETIEDVRTKISGQIEENEQARIRRNDRKAVIAALLEKNDFEVPPALVDDQAKSLMDQAKFSLMMSGFPPERAEEVAAHQQEQIRKDAVVNVKGFFLFSSVAEQEGIEVADQEVDAKIESIANQTNRTVEKVRAQFESDNAIPRLRDEIMQDKALDFLLDHANVEWEEAVPEKGAESEESKGEEAE